jgi:hypothetical protein
MLIIAVIAFLSLSLANPILSKIYSSSLLISRAVPEDSLCDEAEEWDGRYCNEGEGVEVWFDVCDPVDDLVYYPQDECGPGEHCFEYRDADGHDQIDCVVVPTTPDQKDVISTKTQLGKRKFDALSDSEDERIVSVQLQQAIPGASVSGHVMS